MQLSFADPQALSQGAWVVGALEGSALTEAAKAADKASGGAITRALGVSKFTGKKGQVLEVLAPTGVKASRILVVGLGKPAAFDGNAAENAAATAVGMVARTNDTQLTIEIDPGKGGKLKPGQLAAHLAMGVKLKSYTFNAYRTKDLADHESKLKT